MNARKKRILLAVDGSEHSLETVRYVSQVFPRNDSEIILLHVMREIDQAFLDIGLNPLYHKRIAELSAWDEEQKNRQREFMNRARQMLSDAGFAQESVRTNIHESKIGVARDIIEESRHGYSAVAVGRKGHSKFRDHPRIQDLHDNDLLGGSPVEQLEEDLCHIWKVRKEVERNGKNREDSFSLRLEGLLLKAAALCIVYV